MWADMLESLLGWKRRKRLVEQPNACAMFTQITEIYDMCAFSNMMFSREELPRVALGTLTL